MTVSRLVGVCALTLTLGCSSTSPTPLTDVTGTYMATSGHSEYDIIHLRQTGTTLSGDACEVSGPYLIWENAPVVGVYPNVQFTVTADHINFANGDGPGIAFSGSIQRPTIDGPTIVGSFVGNSLELQFFKAPLAHCVGFTHFP
jgi:hypothetical protein